MRKLSIKLLSAVHLFLYRVSGGRIGNRLAGMPILLLETTGRKSGKARVVPLGYLKDGPCYVLIGSNGGQDKHPNWILNLRANARGTVQIRGDRVQVKAEPGRPKQQKPTVGRAD